MNRDEVEIAIRAAIKGDEPLIYSSWLKSYRANSAFSKRIRTDIFFSNHHQVIEAILSRPTTRMLVATVADDPDTILGWFVFDLAGPVLHYVYVKEPFRHWGIATSLVTASGLDLSSAVFTHLTDASDTYQRSHQGLSYNPYPAFQSN